MIDEMNSGWISLEAIAIKTGITDLLFAHGVK
jgi:hypothetical protein